MAVATGLPKDAAALWHNGRTGLQRLLGPADARRLAPMFQQVTPVGGADAAAASLWLRCAPYRIKKKHLCSHAQLQRIQWYNCGCSQVDEALQGTLCSVVSSAAGLQTQREVAALAAGRSTASAAAAAEAAAAELLEACLPQPLGPESPAAGLWNCCVCIHRLNTVVYLFRGRSAAQ